MNSDSPLPQRGYHALIVALLVSIPLTVFAGADSWLVHWFWRSLPIGAAFVLLRRRKWIALALAVVAFGLGASVAGSVGWFAGAVAFGFTALVLLGQVFGHREVTSATVSGALGAYLLLGVTFAMLFGGVHAVDPGSIRGAGEGVECVPDMIYFSFVTLSTLGYGDLVPVSEAARGLAIFEALLGQLFLVAVVARLVGMQGARAAAA